MRRPGAWLWLLLLAVAPAARGAAPDERAAALLEQLEQAQAKLDSLRAAFTQTRVFVHFDERESREGELKFLRGVGLSLRYGSAAAPSELLVVRSGVAELYTPRTAQLQRFRFAGDAGAGDALWPFVPGPAPADVESVRALEPQAGLEGVAVRRHDDSDDPYVERRVWLDPEDGLPRRIELVEPSDDLVIYQFDQLETNQPLPRSAFELDPPADTEVVEHKGGPSL